MNRSATFRGIAAAALGLVALAATTASHARTDVQLSIGIPGVYVQHAPVYAQPRPVYVEPAPVYVQPRPVYVQARPVYVQPRPIHVHPVHAHRGIRVDRDRDGVPDRFDRAPRNPKRH